MQKLSKELIILRRPISGGGLKDGNRHEQARSSSQHSLM